MARRGTRAPAGGDDDQPSSNRFDPVIVKKRQRRLGGVDTIVLSLVAKGLTTGEVSAHFEEIYGASLSKDTISRITDRVITEMTEWMARPLEKGRFLPNVANLDRKDSQCLVGHGTRPRRCPSVATSN